MTLEEFNAWNKHTLKSTYSWLLDEISWINKKVILIYNGGHNGNYVEISPNGLMEIGSYEGAIPHIGEAIFTTTAKKQYANQEDAVMRATEAGMHYLLPLVCKANSMKIDKAYDVYNTANGDGIFIGRYFANNIKEILNKIQLLTKTKDCICEINDINKNIYYIYSLSNPTVNFTVHRV